MLNQYSNMDKPTKVNLFLVEPSQKFSFQFAALRNELETNNVPFVPLVGFDQVKQLMQDKTNKNVVVVNSSNLNPVEFPREIFNVYGNEIYCYPNRFSNFIHFSKPEDVTDLYRRYTGTSSISKSINLRSIKKDLERSRQKREGGNQMYDKIMIMNQRGNNPQYTQLFNVLQGYKYKVTPINRENDVQNYKDGKSLLILQREAFDSMNKFISGNRLDRNIDLAIFGYAKGLDRIKNFAIASDIPNQIVEYIAESGTQLKGAKQKLSIARNNSGVNNSDQNNTGVWNMENQLSFSNPNDLQNGPKFNRGEEVTFANKNAGEVVTYENKNGKNQGISAAGNQGGELVTYTDQIEINSTDQNQIPLASKISEGSKAKKSIKKIKKVQPGSNSKQRTGVQEVDGVVPNIVVHTAQSETSSHGNIELKNQIHFQDSPKKEKKQIMNWYLFPDKKSVNVDKKIPNFILQSDKGQVFNKVNQNQNTNNRIPSQNTIKSISSIGEPSLQSGNQAQIQSPKQKLIMNWYVSPDKTGRSQYLKSNPSFNINRQKQNLPNQFPPLSPKPKEGRSPVPLITPQNAPQAIISQGSINSVNNIGSFNNIGNAAAGSQYYGSNPTQSVPFILADPYNKPVMHWYVQPDKNRKSLHSSGPFFTLVPEQKKTDATATNSLRNISTQPKTPMLSPSKQQNGENRQKQISFQQQSQKSIDSTNQIPRVSPLPVPIVSPGSVTTSIQNTQNNAGYGSQQNMSDDYSRQTKRAAERIQMKYGTVNQIFQVNQEYRGSGLSYPIDETSQRLTINSNSSSYPYNEAIMTTIKRATSQQQPANAYIDPNTVRSVTNSATVYRSQQDNRQPATFQYESKQSLNYSSVDRPTSRVVRNEARAAQTYYMAPSQQTISDKTNTNSISNRNENSNTSIYRTLPVTTPATGAGTVASTTQYITNQVTTNPAYNAINRTIAATAQPPAQETIYMQSPAKNQESRTTIDGVRNRSISPNNNTNVNNYTSVYSVAQQNGPNIANISSNPVISDNKYTAINTAISNSLGDVNKNITKHSYNSNTNNNAITSNNGSTSYNYTNPYRQANGSTTNYNTNTNANNDSVATSPRISQLPTIPKVSQPTTNTVKIEPSKNYLQSLGIDENKYQLVVDQNGVKRYKLKQSVEKQRETDLINRYYSPDVKADANKQVKRENVFNLDEYEEHIDQRGNKYYTVKKTTATKVQQVVTPRTDNSMRGSLSSSNAGQLLLQSKKAVSPTPITTQNLLIQSRFNENNIQSPTTSIAVASQRRANNSINTNNIYNPYNPYAYSITEGSSTNNKNETKTKPSLAGPTSTSYTPSYEQQYKRRGSEVTKMYTGGQLHRFGSENGYAATYENNSSLNGSRLSNTNVSKSPDGRFKTIQKSEQRIEGNKIIQVDKRIKTGPNSQSTEVKIKEQGPYSSKQVYKFESVQKNTVGLPVRNEVAVSRNIGHLQHRTDSRNSQLGQHQQTSGISRDSQFTDSKSSSLYKFNAHLYGDTKNYAMGLANLRVDSNSELQRLAYQFNSLRTGNNFTHYIVDTSHPLRFDIEKLPNVQDQIVEIDIPEKIQDYMHKKPLPNDFYDIGLIFLSNKNINKINPSEIIQGYYVVSIDQKNPTLQLKQDMKRLNVSSLHAVPLARKLLLAPSIQHYVFYPRTNESEISKILNLFPSSKFNKFGYVNKNELENLFGMYLKNKGRLARSLIFVNSSNIDQVAPLLQHSLNRKTFTMVCLSNDPVDDRIKNKYPKVAFQTGFDFGSYGSVISLANNGQKSYIDTFDRLNEQPISKPMPPTSKPQSIPQSHSQLPTVFIQHPHKNLDKKIEAQHPNTYNIKYFTTTSEIKDRNKQNFVLLHRQADNVGTAFDRNIGTVILFEGKTGDRVPSGAVIISTLDELLQQIL